MAETLLNRFRKMNKMLQDTTEGSMPADGLCDALSEALEANAYVSDASGRAIGISVKKPIEYRDISIYAKGDPNRFSEKVLRELENIKEPAVNMSREEIERVFQSDYDSFDRVHAVFPVIFKGERLGNILVTKTDQEFTEEDVVLGEYASVIVGLHISQTKKQEAEEELRESQAVRVAMSSLSFSEVDAAVNIFDELDGDEGLLVASKVADRSGITRSVIVNALRKLESAGIIETRSLGMKGTFIRIVNAKFRKELAKMAK